jgi:hypothetical protein
MPGARAFRGVIPVRGVGRRAAGSPGLMGIVVVLGGFPGL